MKRFDYQVTHLDLILMEASNSWEFLELTLTQSQQF